MFRWTRESIEWFEKAAKKTSFYKDIANIVKDFISECQTALDLGCGTGELTLELAKFVDSVYAVDLCREVIDVLREKMLKSNRDNIYCAVGDWKKIGFAKRFDSVFLCYTGGIIHEFEKLFSITQKFLIVVVPKNKETNNFHLNRILSDFKKDFPETAGEVINFLNEKKVKFFSFEHNCEFGQPFEDIDEFEKFICHYYGKKVWELVKNHRDDFLIESQNGYYLPNVRESEIIVIKK